MSARALFLMLFLLPGSALLAKQADLSERIGGPATAAIQSAFDTMDKAGALAKESKGLPEGVNPSVLMERMQKVQGELRSEALALKGLKAPEGGQASLDEATVLVAQAVAGAGLALEGMRLADRPIVRQGFDRITNAEDTLEDLRTGEGVTLGKASRGRSIGASLGLGASFWSSPVTTNWGLSADGAVPVVSNWDLGAGVSVGGGASSVNGNTSNTSNSGLYLYSRVHFPSQSKPMAPYAGFKVGVNAVGYGGGSEDSHETTLGPQVGILFFTGDHGAVDVNARLDFVNDGDSDWKPQFWLTLGGRAVK